MSRRVLPLVAALVVVVLSGCGVRNSDADRAKVLAATCLSTIARNGLPTPTPEQIAPDRFAAERRRLLATGRRFNTVTPYRNVCNAIRKELRAEAASGPTTSRPVEDDEP